MDNRKTFLCQSSLFSRIRSETSDVRAHKPNQQLSAKLHCLYGVPIEHLPEQPEVKDEFATYPYACSLVYDLQNYTRRSLWGPFMDDETHNVDWEKMEAIMILIGHNWKTFGERREALTRALFTKPFVGAVPNSYVSVTLASPLDQVSPSLKLDDPYDISGTWLRIVCFLDYREFFAYNFASEVPNGQARPPLNTQEAIRFIVAELRTTKVEPPGEDDGQGLPVVHFDGVSRSTNGPWDANANSKIRGTVRLTKDGHVRWTSFSIYDG